MNRSERKTICTMVLLKGILNFQRCFHLFNSKNKLTPELISSLSTHELLQSFGFVKQSRSGLVNWLPLGLRTLKKVENVIHSRMGNDANALEVSLSALSPKSLWETSGRWSNTELFKLNDAKKADYCLTATCEEDITNLMKEYISSHKDMPALVYQITRKYRDELRPRGGLLRGREFLMKDAYSFTSDKDEALKMFHKMNGIYNKIFTDLKVPFISAWADSGDIGGDLSKEYHFIHETGEDTLFRCKSCNDTFNSEKCESLPNEAGQFTGDVDVKYGLTEDHSTLLFFYYPKGRTFNWNLAMVSMEDDIDVKLKNYSNEKILEIFQTENPDLMFANILRIMDIRINSRSNFPDFPLSQYLKNNFGQIDNISLVDAIEDELCGSCAIGELESFKSIEVGHTFHLGTKYSKAFDAKFIDANNKNKLIEMGCYGIGISRLVGAISEISRDQYGFRWPSTIAPYLVSICTTPNTKNDPYSSYRLEAVKEQLNKFKELKGEIYSDFNEKSGLGTRIALSQSIGIPLNIIIGPRQWPNVEIEVRGKRWGNNDSWKQSYLILKDEYKWEAIELSDRKSEKHTVSIEHLGEVIEILLKDL